MAYFTIYLANELLSNQLGTLNELLHSVDDDRSELWPNKSI